MDDLADKIGEFLKDPDAINQVMNLGNMLGMGNEGGKNREEKKESEENSEPIFSDGTLDAILKLMPILASMNQEDEKTRLLKALRPFLKEERRKKVDEAIKMMQLFKLLPLIKSQGIF